MAFYRTEAITMKTSRFAEADKLVVLFTKTQGKVSAIARGALKATSKFGGKLEAFAYSDLLLAKGRNLDIISQAETIETFHLLRERELAFQAGMYIVKVAAAFLEDRVRNEPLFELMVDSFMMLKSGIEPSMVTRMFDVRFADIEGILPFEEFSDGMREAVAYLKNGSFDASRTPAAQLKDLDSVLVPCLSDHLGKDIRLWKNM